MIPEILLYLKSLKNKTFITYYRGETTAPMKVLAVGPKRVHLEMYTTDKQIISGYYKPKAFLMMIIEGVEFVEEHKIAKCILTDYEKDLLDV